MRHDKHNRIIYLLALISDEWDEVQVSKHKQDFAVIINNVEIHIVTSQFVCVEFFVCPLKAEEILPHPFVLAGFQIIKTSILVCIHLKENATRA